MLEFYQLFYLCLLVFDHHCRRRHHRHYHHHLLSYFETHQK